MDYMETDTVPSFGSPAEIPARKTPISRAVRAIITIIFRQVSCISRLYFYKEVGVWFPLNLWVEVCSLSLATGGTSLAGRMCDLSELSATILTVNTY